MMTGTTDATDLVTTARRVAADLLRDRRTKLGGLQIEHAERVAAMARGRGDDRLVAAALLHDVVETSGVDLGVLGELVGDHHVVDLVARLTHAPDEHEVDYLARCAGDPDALVLKRLDLLDKLVSSDESVSPAVARRTRERALERLTLLERLVDQRQHVHPPSGGGTPPGPA